MPGQPASTAILCKAPAMPELTCGWLATSIATGRRRKREKGKVERAIGYTRQNFWPLREFTDLHDVNRQARQWLSEVANQRQHRETRQRPMDPFQPAALKPLPVIPYDYRDHVELLVHKGLRVQFDGNRYCVPHRYVGRRLIAKADSSSVTIYDRA